MARTYNVRGTRDFLYWSLGLLALGIWAIRDGWYPSQKTLDKYPQRMPVHFEVAGTVEDVSAGEGQEVRPGEVLARLDAAEARRKRDAAQDELTGLSEAERVEDTETLIRLRRALEAMQEAVRRHELRAPTGGVIRAVHIEPREEVTPEDKAVALDPRHDFYPFNKSLAVVSLLGSLVCLVIHFKVR